MNPADHLETASDEPTLADHLVDLAIQWEERATELDAKCDVDPVARPEDDDWDDGLDEFGIRDAGVEADVLRIAAKQLRDLLGAEAVR
ncbi:hypothetical protein I0C86_40535 [Plantactinospora sp. S1510]|uniref:Uncharacterized protein n=1 Tax=Plantactinospora alkalitolerans TaxID=2789879 RepID=A0ABS0H9K7_9ACTN|nr:hypothetical protein [Plantactinospora alkalitolerans]MBF9135169.1 hypothetical protein [Plantactinospora alkalitolerans]